jgi:drug/metabolite transporter (DMT)-like permease
VGKAGFITSLYVVIVPVVGLFLGRRPAVWVWLGVAVSVAGLGFLGASGGGALNPGDVLVFFCAFAFAAHILLIARFSPRNNAFALACVQFFTVSIVSLVLAFIFENPSIQGIRAGLGYVLYAGVFPSGAAYILQIMAQKTVEPARASLLFILESVVATFAGWLILGQVLSRRELMGCGLLFIAVFVAQIPSRRARYNPTT